MSYKVLVMSVGGSPEQSVRSIDTIRPEFVCFLVSQQSLNLLGEILTQSEFRPLRTHTEIAEPEDLLSCFEKARQCLAKAKDAGYTPKETVVDITGGTKPMSAGLTVAAGSLGYRFQYVGGREREKGGLGQVISGFECPSLQDNFLDRLAVEERKQIHLLFNAMQFDGARALALKAADKVQNHLRPYFQALAQVIAGYELWDRFDHLAAQSEMRAGLKALLNYHAIRAEHGDEVFLHGVETNLAFLARLVEDSHGGKKLSHYHVLDLLANATRRAAEGAYDDAVARLYRAVEMNGQVALGSHGIDSSDVKPGQIPASLGSRFAERHLGHDGKIQLPLFAAYQLLAALGHEAGKRFTEDNSVLDLMKSRNYSILAHGTTPVKQGAYDSMFGLALNLTGASREELPAVPRMEE